MKLRYNTLVLTLVVALGSCFSPIATAATIAIIGTGQVASALGPEFATQGHDIIYGSRDPSRESVASLVKRTGNKASADFPAKAAARAEIIVLAVPGLVVANVVQDLGPLSGKIIIDPTNPLVRDEQGVFSLGVDTSNAEIIQALTPGAYVVKAFSTLNWRHMIDPQSSGGPISIPMVGDDDGAKATVARLASQMGLEPIDLGPLTHARHVEGLVILWINNRFSGREPFEYHFRTSPR